MLSMIGGSSVVETAAAGDSHPFFVELLQLFVILHLVLGVLLLQLCFAPNLDCAAMLFCDLIENGNISAFTMIVNRMIAIP